ICWRHNLTTVSPQNNLQCITLCFVTEVCCREHVHNVQVCYICILVPCWCAAPINSSFTINSTFSSY
uniref:Uncharacterized protein n=1 Tax=Macaca fascicularis TaxID=9541 RepID=A0A7N9D6J1_MACFA